MREFLSCHQLDRWPRFAVATAFMLFACSPASLKALVSPDGNFNYTIATDKVTITGYTGTGGNVVIPATIGGSPVTTIGQNAFQSKSSVTAVVIPNGVTMIMDAAFAACSSMTAITLPNSLTSIGGYVFDGCSNLQSITLPEGVISIGPNAFAFCTSLPSITLPSGLNTISSGTFWNCTSLTSIIIPSIVNEIQYNAFLNCSKLASVTFLGNTRPTFGNPTPFGGIAPGAKGYYPANAIVAWSGITGLSLEPNVYNRLINGSFEDGIVKPSPGVNLPTHQDNVPGWKTTANNLYTIELWGTGFAPDGSGGSSGGDGNVLAELNYIASGTLYQDVIMTVGTTVSYSFLHRGRSGTETVEFRIDQLVGGPGSEVESNFFNRQVSTGNGAWVRYRGTPAGTVQVGKTYRFSYSSVTPLGGSGNLLDGASFEIDQDGDGLIDSVETNTGTNPSNPDSDNDGLKDGEEVMTYGTNPLLADTDGDGAPDGVEVTAGTNPTVNQALISSGFSHTLYLGAGATTVTAWGVNSDGRLGVGDTASPVNWAKAVQGIPEGATVTGLAAGGTHSLILAGGEVYAAGSDRFGQLGQGAVNGANKTSFTPVAIPSSTPVAVAAGGNHSLIVTADGKVFTCGDNTYGQLAQPATTLSSGTLVEVVFPGLSTKIVSVVAGADHNLAVDEGGGVWVWGRNDSGQLGKNTRTSADRTPVRILLSGAKSLAAGYAHSLILKQDGSVLGFGRNTLGQTGQSSGTSYAKLPIPIPGLSGIRLISAGTDSSFAIDAAGQLRSWGYNAYGELLLGYASPNSSPAVYGPKPSPIATNVFNVSGGGYSSLAVGAQGVIFGGRNDVGQAGNGPDPDQVVGDYYYEAGNLTLSNLTMDLAGTTETLYDQIFVGNGAATLNGIVNLMFVGTYTGPVYGSTQTFDLIWAKNGIVFGAGYQLAFNQAGYLVDSAVADKIVEGVSGKVLQATVRAVVTVADLAKAVDLAKPNLDGVESVSYGVESNEAMGIRQLSVSPSPAVDMVEMIYSYKRPTGGVMSGAEYFVNGVTYRVEYTASLESGLVDWNPAVVTGTTITPLGGGYERATLRISASGSAGFLRLTTEIPPAAGIGAGVGSSVTL